ncbi:DUF6988 family protein [Telluria sp. B2]
MNHLTSAEIAAASAYGESLRQLVHNQELPATPRSNASASCLGIAQEHHHGILLLLSASLYAPAFALVRPMFESYVRGEWLGTCASDVQIESFLHDKDLPKFQILIDALESTAGFEGKQLSGIKKARWNSLCGYTHTGGIHVQRWLTEGSIEPHYGRSEVLEVLHFVEMILALSVLGVLGQSGDELAAQKALTLFRSRVEGYGRGRGD